MSNDNGQSTAEKIVTLTRVFDKVNRQLEDCKVEIRSYEGETFTTEDESTVTVGRASKLRNDGTKLELSEEKYHELDDEVKELLSEKGVVLVVPKTIRASAAKVSVKLANEKIKK